MATTKKTATTTAKKKSSTKKKPADVMPEDIWEKIPGESADQYAKFCGYRDMAYQDGKRLNKRSIRRLAAQHNRTAQAYELLSKKFNWVERCAAYDLELDRKAREAQEKAVIKMREDHAFIASQMIKKATSRLLKMPEEQMSAADIVRMFDVGVKIERLSRGESTENQNIKGSVDHNGTVNVSVQPNCNLSDLSDKELDDLERLLSKIHSKSDIQS